MRPLALLTVDTLGPPLLGPLCGLAPPPTPRYVTRHQFIMALYLSPVDIPKLAGILASNQRPMRQRTAGSVGQVGHGAREAWC